jgi:CDP-glycerol glycerophosphotransferase (TagB/SpsB family)
MAHYLLFATELYALPVLRPLDAAIRAAGDEAAWFAPAAFASHLVAPERLLSDVGAVSAWRPDAVFAASNWVPQFFSGAKVQVFHGFSVDKRSPERGHFRIRGLFDLYCTQGPATTRPFQDLARQHGHFAVAETGWPKLDPLFAADDGTAAALRPADGRPVVLYAATFTETLSSARALLEEITAQVSRGDRYWLLTLHPKIDSALVDAYRSLAGANAKFIEVEDLVPALRAADVLVCDTSSVVSEFVVQRKPVVTFRNRAPKPHMIDISDPVELDIALQRAFAPNQGLRGELAAYADLIHPWRDGHSSERVMGAARDFLAGRFGQLGRKPTNLWRRLQMRSRLRNFGSVSA